MKKLVLITLVLAFAATYAVATFQALSAYQAWARPAQTDSFETALRLPIKPTVGWNS